MVLDSSEKAIDFNMSFSKTIFPFAALFFMLASFSDCDRKDHSKSTASADTLNTSPSKQPAKDAVKSNEATTVDPETEVALQDTTRKASPQDPIEDMPKTGPLPRPLEPRWPGGTYDDMQAFFKKNVKYPEEARKHNIKGTVYVQFMVKGTGEAVDFKVRQGLGHGCDEEAIRVAKLLGKWQPGKIGGKVVDMEYSVGVPFEQ